MNASTGRPTSPAAGPAKSVRVALRQVLAPSVLMSALCAQGLHAQVPPLEAATCLPVPATTPAGQLRANATSIDVATGTFAPTTNGTPAFYAVNSGTINATGPVKLVTTVANTATACAAAGGAINFATPGSTVSRTGTGGPGLRAEAGSQISSTGTSYFTAMASSEGINIVGGSYLANSDSIATGVTLGTQAGTPATFGLPVDANGVLITDPAAYLSRAVTASHGINVSEGVVRINTDAQGNPIAGASSIYVYGSGAGATNGSHGINTTGSSNVSAANLSITTRNNNNFGVRIGGTSVFTATNLDVDTNGNGATALAFIGSRGNLVDLDVSTTGITAHGLSASEGATVTATDFSIRTDGQNAHGIFALTGSSISLDSPGSTIISAGQTGNAIRADGAGSQVEATGLRLSTLRNGGIGVHAASGATTITTGSTIYSSGTPVGNGAYGIQASNGGIAISNGDTIFSGLSLGTDPTLATYGLPVDLAGNPVTDPAQFIESGTTGGIGVFVQTSGGSAWLNVDPSNAAATNSSSSIDTFGNASSGIAAYQSATANSSIHAANVSITTRGSSSPGVFLRGTVGAPAPVGVLSNLDIVTFGANSAAVMSQSGAVQVDDSSLITAGSANGLRSDQGGSSIAASRLAISTLGPGAAAVNATGGAIRIVDSSLMTAGAVSHGMTLGANAGVGTLNADSTDITTGVLLGTDPALATFGKPVDVDGNLVSDPAQYVASGASGHGVFAVTANGRVWINVAQDTSAPTGSSSSIRTFGDNSEGLNIQASGTLASVANVAISTSGAFSNGLRAVAGATIDIASSTVDTQGASAYALTSFRNGTISGTRLTGTTHGELGHGLLAWDEASVVTIRDGSRITTNGLNAHGALAWNGGLIEVFDSNVAANGVGAAALFVRGDPAAATANFTNSTLTNVSGPTIIVNGAGEVSLTATTVGGSDHWLTVGTADDFPPLTTVDLPIMLVPDPPEPVIPMPPESDNTVGMQGISGQIVGRIQASASTLNGAATTLAGSESDLTLSNDTVWNLTGDSNLTHLSNNASLIQFSAPAGGVFKRLTTTNYGGAGGTLALNTVLGTDASPSDRLVIESGAGTGQSWLRITNVGGSGANTFADGIRLVDAVDGATTASDAFSLEPGTRVVAGAHEYLLFRGGVTNSADNDNDWFLRSEAPPPPPPDPDPPGPAPDPEPVPIYRPEIAAYLGNARAATGMFVHTLHERLGAPRYTQDLRDPADDEDGVGSMWLRAVYREVRVRPFAAMPFTGEAHVQLVHGGGDLAKFSVFDEDDRLHLGAMAAYGETTIDARAAGNPNEARGQTEGFSYGAYATWYANEAQRHGWYVDLWGMWGKFDNRVSADAMPDLSYDSRTATGSIEVAYAELWNDDRFALEPQMQYVYTDFKQDQVRDASNTLIEVPANHASTGRLGLRFFAKEGDRNSRKIEPYLEINWWHDFQEESVSLNGEAFRRGIPDDRYELGIGFAMETSDHWRFWANMEGQVGAHDYSAFEATAGVLRSW